MSERPSAAEPQPGPSRTRSPCRANSVAGAPKRASEDAKAARTVVKVASRARTIIRDALVNMTTGVTEFGTGVFSGAGLLTLGPRPAHTIDGASSGMEASGGHYKLQTDGGHGGEVNWTDGRGMADQSGVE